MAEDTGGAAAVAIPEKAARKPTSYVVLRRYELEGEKGRELWEPMHHADAKTPKEACQLGAKACGLDGAEMSGDWRAVPQSSWKGGLRVETEVKTLPIFTDLP